MSQFLFKVSFKTQQLILTQAKILKESCWIQQIFKFSQFPAQMTLFHPQVFSLCLWLFILIVVVLQNTFVQSACIYSSKCDVKCLNQICQDPSTNAYYNSSVSNTSAGYHGQGCCTGCASPYSYDHYYDSAAKTCFKGNCPKDSNGVQQYWNRDNTCQLGCNDSSPYKKNAFLGVCEFYCSEGYYEFNNSGECLNDCPVGTYKKVQQYYPTYQRTCTADCGGWYVNTVTKACETQCSSGFADNDSKECVDICPVGKYKYNQTKKCVWKQLCYTSYSYFADDLTGYCSAICSNSYLGDLASFSCVSACSNGTYKLNITYGCCPAISRPVCASKEFCNNATYNSQSYFINEGTQSCESICTNGLYADPVTKSCKSTCPTDYYMYNQNYTNGPILLYTKRTCVNLTRCRSISPYYFANNNSMGCQFQCLKLLYGDTSSGYCLSQCPNNAYKFQHYSQKTCVLDCTSLAGYTNSFINDDATRSCIINDSNSNSNSNFNPNQNYYQWGSSGSSTLATTNITINLSLRDAIIIGAGLVAVAAGIVACFVYMVKKANFRKRYMSGVSKLTTAKPSLNEENELISINSTFNRINVHHN